LLFSPDEQQALTNKGIDDILKSPALGIRRKSQTKIPKFKEISEDKNIDDKQDDDGLATGAQTEDQQIERKAESKADLRKYYPR
jgi:hypothetical protein